MSEPRRAAPQAADDRRRADDAGHVPRGARHRGGTVLAMGILGLALCFPLGFVAWSMADHDLKRMRSGRMDTSGEGLTRAGKICGMVGGILGALWAAYAILTLLTD
jgi:hypothetical protein